MNTKKVLVTGANGFTGANLCRELVNSGAKVRAFVTQDNPANLTEIKDDLEIFVGDVRSEDDTLKATYGVDYLFHLATYSSVIGAKANPKTAFDINIRGSYNVFQSAVANDVGRSIFVSTCHVYGNPPNDAYPLKEDVIPKPNDFYSSCRRAAEVVLEHFINQGHDIVVTRAFNHYGPFQTGNHLLIPAIVRKAMNNKNPILNSPSTTRDFSYVTDIVKGYMLAAEKGQKGETYHFSSGQETSGGEICELILKILNEDFGIDSIIEPVWAGQRDADMHRSSGDSSKAKEYLSWKPTIGLEEGIRRTLAWWQQSAVARKRLAE